MTIAFFCCMITSCKHHGISLKYTESRSYYSMDAWFNENRTRALEEYMDDQIGKRNHISFVNSGIDGKIGLDDHTTFFIKKVPGHLKIELNKRENSVDGYMEIKNLCEGIKEVVK